MGGCESREVADLPSDGSDPVQATFLRLAALSPDQPLVIDKETFRTYFPLEGLLADRLFHAFDTNHNGTIEYSEFVAGCCLFMPCPRRDKARLLFSMYDLDGTGRVSRAELRTMLQSMMASVPAIVQAAASLVSNGRSIGLSEAAQNAFANPGTVDLIVDDAFRVCDVSHTGSLSRAEFELWVERCPAVVDAVFSHECIAQHVAALLQRRQPPPRADSSSSVDSNASSAGLHSKTARRSSGPSADVHATGARGLPGLGQMPSPPPPAPVAASGPGDGNVHPGHVRSAQSWMARSISASDGEAQAAEVYDRTVVESFPRSRSQGWVQPPGLTLEDVDVAEDLEGNAGDEGDSGPGDQTPCRSRSSSAAHDTADNPSLSRSRSRSRLRLSKRRDWMRLRLPRCTMQQRRAAMASRTRTSAPSPTAPAGFKCLRHNRLTPWRLPCRTPPWPWPAPRCGGAHSLGPVPGTWSTRAYRPSRYSRRPCTACTGCLGFAQPCHPAAIPCVSRSTCAPRPATCWLSVRCWREMSFRPCSAGGRNGGCRLKPTTYSPVAWLTWATLP
eukprot:m.155421 g.155421  ORF g.155421 m.155421 type:complete len:558 (-) comp20807_c9_seq2:1153-2826(-)